MTKLDRSTYGDSIGNRYLRRVCSRVALSSLVCILASACAPESPDNFVLISLDTVRRDHLSAYGYERPTSPFLDSLADTGVLFLDAFAQATNTAPSHASMFTGLYPQSHGLVRNGYPLPTDGPVTMAELLRAQGFRTGAFISGYTLAAEISGLDRGFEIYDDEFDDTSREGSSTLEQALSWLAGLGPDDRFFLFFHLFDAHGPYVPPAEVDGLFESEEPGPNLPRIAKYQRQVTESGERIANENFYVDRYDELIRYEDDLVERLLRHLDLTDTVVLITADHGETLGERYHAFDHGGRVFEEQIGIPMILSAPDLGPRIVEGAVETIDFLPTIVDLLGLTLPPELEIEGRSVAPRINTETPGKSWVYSTAQATRWRLRHRGYRLDENRQVKSVRSEQWKLIRYPGLEDDYLELYDLTQDPEETSNVAEQFPQVRDRLLDELKSWEGGWTTGVSPSEQLDPEVADRLRALGYLGD